jgi:hypothetical protein
VLQTAEHRRLSDNQKPPHLWYRWGPYVSERQWGTVREDYSADGDAWNYFSHDQARSRVYRWGEDGIGGFSDRHGLLNFTVALWNGKDSILKERLFGLTNSEGNHGEDVKELYYYLDALPSAAYLKMLYRYPIAAFPYDRLVSENKRRDAHQPEFEILDTGVFDRNTFVDVIIEYAKVDTDDILWRVTLINRSDQAAPIWVMPQVTARNNWGWGQPDNRPGKKPSFRMVDDRVELETLRYGCRYLVIDQTATALFTDNETNRERLYRIINDTVYVKDAFHRFVIDGDITACNPDKTGTKMALLINTILPPGGSHTLRMRFKPNATDLSFDQFDQIMMQRLAEADEFYAATSRNQDPMQNQVLRQAFAGLIWSKQFYHYDVERWLKGDPNQPGPPASRPERNANWIHFNASDVLSMPDKWEYPWFASWDLALHCVAWAMIDPHFAKEQMLLVMREWFMHPNGQIPAYEWAFGDVNPPLQAWAAHRIFRIERRVSGTADFEFLEKVFQKLLLNFTWWTNRKDSQGNNLFEGGFLGLDNIGIFDRSTPLPNGMTLEQSDGTSWMAMYCLSMMGIAVDLAANHDAAYEDIAVKFFEHFVYIASAMSKSVLWNEQDGFYYDMISMAGDHHAPIKLRSMVGLLPIIACVAIDTVDYHKLSGFRRRMDWFLENRPEIAANFTWHTQYKNDSVHVFSLVEPDRLRRVLGRMLDEREFLSAYGIRSLSGHYRTQPFEFSLGGQQYSVSYEAAESTTRLFGGNSNWRGPIWFPVNYLLIEALQRHGYFLGESWKIEFPTGSGQLMSLQEIADELERRLIKLFLPDARGKRPVHVDERYANDPLWKDLLLFYEYFDSDNGRGAGASHQTGWSALVAKLIDQQGRAS